MGTQKAKVMEGEPAAGKPQKEKQAGAPAPKPAKKKIKRTVTKAVADRKSVV
jgi:hypothetical protein